jgi:hypothetical protein
MTRKFAARQARLRRRPCGPIAVNMHRRSLTWVLSLLLLFAQHGAVLHELSHLSHGTTIHGAMLDLTEQQPDNGACPTCQAFSQIANPATASAIVLAFSPVALTPVLHPSYAIVGAEIPTPRSRGPPQV